MRTPKNTNKMTIHPLGFVSFFLRGFRVIGNVFTENDLRVEGIIQGNIKTIKKIIIGESGQVIGDIEGAEVVILGEVIGKVIGSKTIIVGSKGLLHGAAITDDLQVECGAEIDASIQKYNALIKEVNLELSPEIDMGKDEAKKAINPQDKELISKIAILN
ncbi:polymer-forming cytoskeletal protein [uncultured Cyclobacterium sp.]|uniref:bactofilin family protein n=1 Tax=uncultured Cyclobacterium sp. TaxID=453820 RepID=UPI0030EF98C6|tara:strand:- start:152353 stop:152832 length:480 start_codon:yes stop_codon:yes gene_type:complete